MKYIYDVMISLEEPTKKLARDSSNGVQVITLLEILFSQTSL